MASLFITELANLTTITPSAGQLVQAPFCGNGTVAEQRIPLTGTASSSAAWNTATRFVMLNTDIACSLAFGATTASITATTTSHRLGPNETRFYGVNPGGIISAISSS